MRFGVLITILLLSFLEAKAKTVFITRANLDVGYDASSFENSQGDDATFSGVKYGFGIEKLGEEKDGVLGYFLEYIFSNQENTANTSLQNEEFKHSLIRLGFRLHASSVLLGLYGAYANSKLEGKIGSSKFESKYSGLGYGAEAGYELQITESFRIIPKYTFTRVRLEGKDNNITRDGSIYGPSLTLAFDF